MIVRGYSIGKGADFRRANLEGANLQRAHLGGATLSGANLEGADLRRANLTGANLTGAHLERAHLEEADLEGAYLAGAHLEGATLAEAYLEGATLAGAHLAGANLAETSLDPAATPNGDVEGFETLTPFGQLLVRGYRTRNSYHMDPDFEYESGKRYEAPYFSVAEMECHPGLYLCPTADGIGDPISVIARAADVHHAGSKWRCRTFWVGG